MDLAEVGAVDEIRSIGLSRMSYVALIRNGLQKPESAMVSSPHNGASQVLAAQDQTFYTDQAFPPTARPPSMATLSA